MQFKPNFVPRKRKWSYKFVVPFVLLIIIVSALLVTAYIKKNPKDDTSFTVCNLNVKKSKELLKKTNTKFKERDTKPVSDYSYYGEVLKLYQDKYKPNSKDPLIGHMLYITNVCDNTSQTLISSADLDSGIDLSKLEDGFYSIEVLTDIDPFVMESQDAWDYEFSSIKRNGSLKVGRLLAKKQYYDELDSFDKNYVFLEVRSVEDNQEYDVILDPSAGNQNNNGTFNFGHFYKGHDESELTYELAKAVEKILLDHDVRVMVSRDNKTGINYYGDGGRIKGAYEGQAKYYIHMRTETSGSKMDRGLLALYSNFTSNRLANSLVESIIAETNFQTTPYEDRSNISGVYRTNRLEGLDNNPILRETGGRYTGAGVIDPYDTLMPFAKDNLKGMHSINVLYGYLTDEKDLAIWENNIEALALGSAKGILKYLNIEYKGD